MRHSKVLLARPGELIRAQAAVSLWATRAGGLPTYPAGCGPPETDPPTCQACGKPLALLLQAHAPLSGDQLEGGDGQSCRFLFVFGCAAEGCGKQPGCFRAQRLVSTPSSGSRNVVGDGSSSVAADVKQQEQAKQEEQQQQAAPVAAADEWGVGGGDDWGVAGGGADDWGAPADASGAEAGQQGAAAGAGAFDFGDLNAALEAMGSTKAASKSGRAGGQSSCTQAAPAGPSEREQAQPVYRADWPCLPAFYLYAEAEAEAGSGGGGSEQQHLAALLARYEAEAAAASDAAEVAPALLPAAMAAGACLPGGSGGSLGGIGSAAGGGETWGGEGYEEDAVLAPGGGKKALVGAAYLKFGKQVARCPDQCARYSFGGAPLWPTAAPPPPPPPCPLCGAPRTFELQLMAPLIHGLSESAEWLAAEGGAVRPPGLLLPPDSWEWLTLAVYTCSRSCGAGGAAAAEAVAVANEEA